MHPLYAMQGSAFIIDAIHCNVNILLIMQWGDLYTIIPCSVQHLNSAYHCNVHPLWIFHRGDIFFITPWYDQIFLTKLLMAYMCIIYHPEIVIIFIMFNNSCQCSWLDYKGLEIFVNNNLDVNPFLTKMVRCTVTQVLPRI